MSKSLKRVQRALEAAGIQTAVLEMHGETRTAAAAACEAKCEIDQIAKSIIFRGETSGEAILFITAGGNQVDPILAACLAGERLGRAAASFVRSETGFAIGGVAPIGHLKQPTCFIDPRLFEFESVYAAAGTPKHIFPISPNKLQKMTNSKVSNFVI